MSLEQLLSEVRQRRLMLTSGRTGRVILWSPNQYVPLSIRQAIHAHSYSLYLLMQESVISVCSNPDLHRNEWDYRAGRYVCSACSRLLDEVSA